MIPGFSDCRLETVSQSLRVGLTWLSARVVSKVTL